MVIVDTRHQFMRAAKAGPTARFIPAVCASLLLALASPANAADLIVNGNFETANASGTAPADWTIVTQNADARSLLWLDGNFYTPYGLTGSTAALDNHFMVFGAYDTQFYSTNDPNVLAMPPSAQAVYLEQSFMTVAGATYHFSMDMGVFGSAANVPKVAIYGDNGLDYDEEFGSFNGSLDASGIFIHVPIPLAVQSGLDTFVGTGGMMTLRIEAFGDTYSTDLFIDNVAIDGPSVMASPAPEPASWVTLIAGFAMIGARLRRRGRAYAPTSA